MKKLFNAAFVMFCIYAVAKWPDTVVMMFEFVFVHVWELIKTIFGKLMPAK